MNRNINWHCNTCNDTHHGIGPESGFLTSQIWMNDLEADIQANGVEIIELNSTDDSRSSNEDPRENTNHMSHPWSYARDLKNLEDEYKETRQARLRRRLRNRNRFPEDGTSELDDSFYCSIECRTPDTAEVETFTQTCFQILDKLSALQLSSSSEDSEEKSNEARYGDNEPGWNCERHSGEEIITYNSGLKGEKQTVWIYSFNNRRILSDHDYELVNIPSQEAGAYSIHSSDSNEPNTSNSTRVSSPIPATHIPRLDLSLGSTLPNVTEVTEPKSVDSLNQRYMPITQKPANNWCSDNAEKVTEKKSSNILNWMALSPRHKSEIPIALQPVPEVSQDEEEAQVNTQFKPDIVVEPATIGENQRPNRGEFDTEITNENAMSKPSSQVNSARTSVNSKRETFVNNETYLVTPLALRCKTRNREQNNHNAVDSALNDVKVGDKVKRPRITVESIFLSPISKTIENIDSDEWIGEQKEKFRGDRRCRSAGDKAMIRNLPRLKPAEWKTYSPIAGRKLFIELPVEPEFEGEKTLLQRCVSCFKCCK